MAGPTLVPGLRAVVPLTGSTGATAGCVRRVTTRRLIAPNWRASISIRAMTERSLTFSVTSASRSVTTKENAPDPTRSVRSRLDTSRKRRRRHQLWLTALRFVALRRRKRRAPNQSVVESLVGRRHRRLRRNLLAESPVSPRRRRALAIGHHGTRTLIPIVMITKSNSINVEFIDDFRP